VAIHQLNQEATSRGARMLRTALGPAIALWLEEPSVVEVMLNPDGRLPADFPSERLEQCRRQSSVVCCCQCGSKKTGGWMVGVRQRRYASATASLPSGFIADVSKKGLKKSPSTGGAVALDGAHDLAAYIWPDGTAGPFPDYFVSAAVASSIAAGILATDRSERDLVEQLISVFLLGQGF
jgi:hypothetical protein